MQTKAQRLLHFTFLRRAIGVCTAICMFASITFASQAAALSSTTMVNGVWSTLGGCQTDNLKAITDCSNHETLTQEVPVQLEFNPISTHIVILGAGLYDDGTMRPVLIERLRAGLFLARRYPLVPIIVSGGVPRSGVTEAGAMHRWLREQRIPEWRITEENTSRSTVENARNTNQILIARGAPSIVVVTSRDHLRRAMINFRTAVAGRISVAGVVAA